MSITPRFALALTLSVAVSCLLLAAGAAAAFSPDQRDTRAGVPMLFSSDCTDMEQRVRGVEVNGLRLKAELVDDVVTTSSKVTLKLTATNVSGPAKTLAECAPFMDYTLCIEDPYGTMTRIEWKDYGGRYKCVSHTLSAGESFSIEYVISDVYDFTKVGIYHITAGCKTIGRNGPGSVNLVSNAVELTVRPCSDAAEIAEWRHNRHRHLRPLWPMPDFDKGQPGADVAGFTLSASAQLPQPTGSDPAFDLTLTLTNTSQQDRVIYQSEPTATYFLCIEGPVGKPTLPGVHITLSSVSQRKEIAPGDTLVDVFPVRGCFKLTKEGEYHISAARLVPSLSLTHFQCIYSNVIDMYAAKNDKGELELRLGKQPEPKPKSDTPATTQPHNDTGKELEGSKL